MSWTLTTSGAAILKAGVNANSTLIATAASLATFSDQTEAKICTETGYDWVTNYASVSTNFQQALSEAASSDIAMKIISYDMSGYTSRYEAETILDVLRDDFTRLIAELSKPPTRKVMGV